MAGIDQRSVAGEVRGRNPAGKCFVKGGYGQAQNGGLPQCKGRLFDFEIFSSHAGCQQDQWNNYRQNHAEPDGRGKKCVQDRSLAGDKVVPIKIGSHDDAGKGDGQKVPEQIITLKTPDDVFGQLV